MRFMRRLIGAGKVYSPNRKGVVSIPGDAFNAVE